MNQTLLFLALVFFSSPALAESVRLNCNFERFATPEGLKKAESSFKLEFTIDTVTGDAMMVGNNGMTKVHLIKGSKSVTFLEPLESGSVQTTTVVTKTGEAVHSRHTVLTNELVPSQYYGVCR